VLIQAFPEPLLLTLVASLETMAKGRDWRSRAAAVRGVPAFAPYVTNSQVRDRLAKVFFDAQFAESDSISS
jgi:hypothetical protein